MVNAYADVCQQVPEKKGKQGYVDVQLLGGEDTTESMMKQSLEIVTELTAMGVPANKSPFWYVAIKPFRTLQPTLWRIPIL